MKPSSDLTSSVASDGSQGSKKKSWNFATLDDLHVQVNSVLRQAMLNERYKRWRKVIELYKELLWLISLEHFPDDYEPPSSYSMLLYELHFHLGVAYQQLDNHQKAAKEFTKTIEVVSIAKNGCLAGCLTNSCLMTPIYTRRAFANAKRGSYKLSLKDAEKAVVLDSASPDVYCIRALVRSTFDDELMGLKDLDVALKLDKNHVCSNMLKASFTKPLVTDDNEQYGFFGGKAVRMCQEAETYLTCNSFVHPCIKEFYDKFLFSLSVPHTITRINLTPEKPSKKQLENSHHLTPRRDNRDVDSQMSEITAERSTAATPSGHDVFRCGMAVDVANNRMNLKRRTDYGKAIRKYMARPKSAPEFFAQLERQQRLNSQQKRCQSALVKPGSKFARPFLSTMSSQNKSDDPCSTGYSGHRSDPHLMQSTPLDPRPFTAPVNSRLTTMSPIRSVSPEKYQSSPAVMTPDSAAGGRSNVDGPTQAHVNPFYKKPIAFDTPKDYAIPVFQAVNIKDAPRMYYRPWSGDKLPVSERVSYKFAPAFY